MSCSRLQRQEQYDQQYMNVPMPVRAQMNMQMNAPSPSCAGNMGSLAGLNAAFSESRPMAEFQQKMMNSNSSLIAQNLSTPMTSQYAPFESTSVIDYQKPITQTEAINKNIQGIVEGFKVSPQSEEKMRNSIDEVMKTMDMYSVPAETTCSTGQCPMSKQSFIQKEMNALMQPHIVSQKQINNGYPWGTLPNDIYFPLTRTQYYPPNELGTSLLEGYGLVDDITQDASALNKRVVDSTGMSIFKLFLLFLLIIALLYGIYHLWTDSPTKTSSIQITTSKPTSDIDLKTVTESIKKFNKQRLF
jgi:hypothetical protein